MAAKKGGFINEVLSQREQEAKNRPQSVFRSDYSEPVQPAQREQTERDTRKSGSYTFRMKPYLYENLKKIAHEKHTTANALINEILEEYSEEHAELIRKYNAEA